MIAVRATLDAAGLTIATRVTSTGSAGPVPIAFGWHPYLNLPDDPHVTLPVHTRVVLDERKLPTGATEPVDFPPDFPLHHPYDGGFTGVAEGARFVLRGGGRETAVEFLRGYPCAQLFVPEGQGLIAFEPMTAPTNALHSGDGLRRESDFEAVFRVATALDRLSDLRGGTSREVAFDCPLGGIPHGAAGPRPAMWATQCPPIPKEPQ